VATPAEAVTATVPVVLLGGSDALRTQMRTALSELGAELLHEGDIAGADCRQIIALAPRVVLVNLEAGSEDALDALDELFAEPSINVVFNEAEASSQLSGWDLARWARHLAAKVLGHTNTVPPPPVGAEALPDCNLQPEPGAPPTPAEEVGDVAIDSFAAEAANSEAAVPSSPRLEAAEIEPVEIEASEIEAVEIEAVEIEAVEIEEVEIEEVEIEEVEFETAEFETAEIAAVELEDITSDPAEALPDAPRVALERELHGGVNDAGALAQPIAVAVDRDLHGGQASDEFNLDLGDIELSLSELQPTMFESAAAEAPVANAMLEPTEPAAEPLPQPHNRRHTDKHPALDEDGGFGLDFDFDQRDGALPVADDDTELDLSLDPDVAALSAQLESLAERPLARGEDDFAAGNDGDLTLDAPAMPAVTDAERRDPGSQDALAAFDQAAGLADADVPAAAPSADLDSLARAADAMSLAPMEDPADQDDNAAAPAADGKPAAAPAGYDFSSLSLSLAPIEGEEAEGAGSRAPAVAPSAAVDPEASGPGGAPDGDPQLQAEAGPAISRVLVLGASIGGPDALRTFLAALPANFPALLLLCQHLDNGFFGRLAQQLQKVSKLPVRVVEPDGAAARSGEILIVPSSHRFLFDEDGRIEAREHTEAPRYKPCIDDLMQDIAERFGNRATAIVFSGMAGDAVEGAVQITARGGEVWAQSPDSCVVSSMVDGARARGVVEFVGSPRELAEKCIERYGRG
jgi:chemotaxis response regulator CheB